MNFKNKFLTIRQEFGSGNARQLQLLRFLVGWETPAIFNTLYYESKRPRENPRTNPTSNSIA